jgi:hypothetical protein
VIEIGRDEGGPDGEGMGRDGGVDVFDARAPPFHHVLQPADGAVTGRAGAGRLGAVAG